MSAPRPVMRKLLLAVVVAAVAIGLAGVRVTSVRRAARRTERARIVAAPLDVVLAELGDLRRWSAWSPWEGAGARGRVYGGPQAGPGASVYWQEADGRHARLTVLSAGDAALDVELEREGRPGADLELRLSPAEGCTRVALAYVAEPDLSTTVRAFFGRPHPVAATLEEGLARLSAGIDARPRIETYRLVRSSLLRAAPAAVIARAADPRGWEQWSPWGGPRSGARRTFGGPPKGPGATLYWSAGPGGEAGGRITVVRVGADALELELELEGASSDLELRVAPEDGGTRATWTLSGAREPGDPAPRPAATLEADLERGLSRLKALMEPAPPSRRRGPSNRQ